MDGFSPALRDFGVAFATTALCVFFGWWLMRLLRQRMTPPRVMGTPAPTFLSGLQKSMAAAARDGSARSEAMCGPSSCESSTRANLAAAQKALNEADSILRDQVRH